MNRLDLRDAVGYGNPGNAGELRFVFGLVNSGRCRNDGTIMIDHGRRGHWVDPVDERGSEDDFVFRGGLDVPGGGGSPAGSVG